MIPLPPTRRTRSAVSGFASRFCAAHWECDAFRIAFKLGANFPKATRGRLRTPKSPAAAATRTRPAASLAK